MGRSGVRLGDMMRAELWPTDLVRMAIRSSSAVYWSSDPSLPNRGSGGVRSDRRHGLLPRLPAASPRPGPHPHPRPSPASIRASARRAGAGARQDDHDIVHDAVDAEVECDRLQLHPHQCARILDARRVWQGRCGGQGGGGAAWGVLTRSMLRVSSKTMPNNHKPIEPRRRSDRNQSRALNGLEK